MEELLRNYFLNLGYYVIRGLKLKYENNDLTDIDLFLYGRSSSLIRQRINVDLKNKKSPQAFERIVWANGLMKILNFDSCIVATTDSRNIVHSFALNHKTTLLDGNFLQKLKDKEAIDRISEDELLINIAKFKSYQYLVNKDWKFIYENSKSKLLTEMDYSGYNSALLDLNYFINKYLTDVDKKEWALRLIYLILSHSLIIMDYIVKDIAYLDQNEKEKKLLDGLKYGNLGKDGVDKIIDMAYSISGNKSVQNVKKVIDSIPNDILRDFFSKNDVSKNLFSLAKEFEYLGFNRTLINPDKLDIKQKTILSVVLDFLKIERTKFFK